jgi:S-methylmethionine-dependent homocysteine/selenocysteine methylase
MSDYSKLQARLANREVILLDGAIGTQLQSMGVPMNNRAWAGIALKDYPYTVQRMHENYIKAGVDVITVNTYPSARHNLEPLGLADMTVELNLRAVMLAEDARDRAASERPVYIAGAVSNYGLLTGSEPGWRELAYFQGRSELSEQQAQANLREQAEILAEAGVDFLLAEATGSNLQRRWVVEACLATGLPVWTGFKVRLDEGDASVRVGYRSELALADGFDEIASLGGAVITLFHSSVASTDAALVIAKNKWRGPLGIYPEAERVDYVEAYRDRSVPTRLTPEQFLSKAMTWVEQGVQVIGGCCGVELEYIQPLRERLPTHIPGVA